MAAGWGARGACSRRAAGAGEWGHSAGVSEARGWACGAWGKQALGAGGRRGRARGAARRGRVGGQTRGARGLGTRAGQGCALGALGFVFNLVFRLGIFPESLN